MNTQPQRPQDINPVTAPVPTEAPLNPVEAQTVAPQPEAMPAGVTPEVAQPPVVEVPNVPEVDHLSNVAQPIINDDAAATVDPAPTDDATAPIVEPESVNEDELDKKYFKEADEAIDTLEEKPFEEEEKSEDLQIGYLKDRFGKELHKSDD